MHQARHLSSPVPAWPQPTRPAEGIYRYDPVGRPNSFIVIYKGKFIRFRGERIEKLPRKPSLAPPGDFQVSSGQTHARGGLQRGRWTTIAPPPSCGSGGGFVGRRAGGGCGSRLGPADRPEPLSQPVRAEQIPLFRGELFGKALL